MDTQITWKNKGLEFKGTNSHGISLDLASDIDKIDGAEGFGPMELLSLGLAGCTGMDVLAILKKKRQDVLGFEVKIKSASAKEHPHVWNWVQIEYLITGRNIDSKAVERALKLSSEKYCPAQNMINKSVEIEQTYKIIESQPA